MKNWFKLVWTGFWWLLVVLVQFFLYFQTRQPVAVPVHPKKAEKLDQTGPLFTILWTERINYANLIKNRSPTQVLQKQMIMPYEAFWGGKPDLSLLEEFG